MCSLWSLALRRRAARPFSCVPRRVSTCGSHAHARTSSLSALCTLVWAVCSRCMCRDPCAHACAPFDFRGFVHGTQVYTVYSTPYSLLARRAYYPTAVPVKAQSGIYNTVLPVTECESSDQRTTDQWSPDPRRRGTLNSERSREFLVSRRHPPLSASGTMKTQG